MKELILAMKKELASLVRNGDMESARRLSDECASMENSIGARENKGKPRWSLVDFQALEPMVKVLEYGAEKYSDHNWKLGLPYTEIAESLIRHLVAFLSGDDDDLESGLLHVGHIACNAMFLAHMAMFRKDMDDRLSSTRR